MNRSKGRDPSYRIQVFSSCAMRVFLLAFSVQAIESSTDADSTSKFCAGKSLHFEMK